MGIDSDYFLGKGWSFPPSFSKDDRGVVCTSGEENIEKSLKILLSTGLNERLMHPDYGADLNPLMFENLNTTLISYMKDIIQTAILYWEDRVLVEDVSIAKSGADEDVLEIEIWYKIKLTNNRYNFVFPFYLNEGFNVETNMETNMEQNR